MRLTILSLMLGLAAPAAYAAPHAVVRHNPGEAFVLMDLGSIQRAGNLATARLMFVFRTPSKTFGSDSRVTVARGELEIDCAQKRARQRSQDTYDNTLKLIASSEATYQWTKIVTAPGSEFAIACGEKAKRIEEQDWMSVATRLHRTLKEEYARASVPTRDNAILSPTPRAAPMAPAGSIQPEPRRSLPTTAPSSQRARYEEAQRISVELKRIADARCSRSQQDAKQQRGNPMNLYNQLEACDPYANEVLPKWADCEPICQVITLGMIKDGYAKIEAARRGR